MKLKIADMHCDTLSVLRRQRRDAAGAGTAGTQAERTGTAGAQAERTGTAGAQAERTGTAGAQAEGAGPSRLSSASGPEGPGLRKNTLHVDLDKMQRGGYLVQNFAMFVNLREEADPWKAVEEMSGLFRREMEACSGLIGPVTNWTELERNREAGRMSAFLTMEEGGVCGGRIEKLEKLYEMGVRMLTLTWNYPNELGYPNLFLDGGNGRPDYKRPNTEQGLTETGICFVEEMERMGMIPDVSHLSDAGFYDVLNHTKKPFVASHSNARAVCPWVRNLTDDMIRRLGERGGVTGLNYCADFLTEGKPGEKNPGTIQAVVEHAVHIADTGGIECLGLGSDFDGIDTHGQLPDASSLPLLAEALHKGGFKWSDIDKILGSNVLRIYRDCLAR